MNQLDAAAATHAHAADTGGILFGSSDAGLVTAILEGNSTITIGSAGNTCHEAQTCNRRAIVDNDILDVSTAVQHTEQTYILLLCQTDHHIADIVLLTVESALERTSNGTNGLMIYARHVDVGCQNST